MILTDEILKKEFKYGMSIAEISDDEPTPLRGLPEAWDDNPEVFALWINPYSETLFPRDVSDEAPGEYHVERRGVLYRIVPIPESQKVAF